MVNETQTSNNENNVMTTSEVMNYLKVSRKTVLKLVHDGKLPAQKVGKDFRYLKSAVDSFLRGGIGPEDQANNSYFST